MKAFSLAQYHKPALYTFAGICAGILVSEHFVTVHSSFARISLCVFLLTCIASWLLFRKNISLVRNGALLLAAISLGSLLHSSAEALYEESSLRKFAASIKEEVVLYGEVVAELDKSDFGTMYSFRTDSARVGDYVYPVSGIAAIQAPPPFKG